MSSSAKLLPPENRSGLRGLQLFAREAVEGFCTGLHRSPHKGASVEFKQHRPYVPGDEIRRIDWKAYARSDRHYIREFEDETNLNATILLDTSGSMGYTGTAGLEKFEYARRLAASLAHLLLLQGDAVGLATFDTKIRSLLPTRSRSNHLEVICKALEEAVTGGETDPGDVLAKLAPRLRARGLVVLISDCFGEVTPLSKALGLFRHRGHDVIVFNLWDRDELDFPFKRWTKFIDLEDEEVSHTIDPATLRKGYLERLATFREELVSGCAKNRVELVPLVTDEALSDALAKYMNTRLRGRAKK